MRLQEVLEILKNRFMEKRLVCRVFSGRRSALYGVRFSYPLYILLVTVGILLVNPYILATTALIAFFGVILPMHPFDYLYNFVVSKINSARKIPGRGSELQFNSIVALIFNLGVIVTIIYEFTLNYEVLALMYVFNSTLFIIIQLTTDDFSLFSLSKYLFNKGK